MNCEYERKCREEPDTRITPEPTIIFQTVYNFPASLQLSSVVIPVNAETEYHRPPHVPAFQGHDNFEIRIINLWISFGMNYALSCIQGDWFFNFSFFNFSMETL